jgi:hypothetical protein
MAVQLYSAPINIAKNKAQILWGCQPFLSKPSYSYFTIFYDDGHCPLTVRASEWPFVVGFRWLQGDTFATAQANYSRGASWTSLVLFLMAS